MKAAKVLVSSLAVIIGFSKIRQLSHGGMVGSARHTAAPYISYATMNRAGKLHASRGRHRRGRVSSERRGWDAGTRSGTHDGDAPGTPHHLTGRGQPTLVASPSTHTCCSRRVG